MPDPLISVVIATFDMAHYLTETLASVFAQTHRRREVIVVDDGSRDDTARRLQPFRDAITYIHQENAGLGAARNRGIRAAGGDYLAFLDADDLWHPEALEAQLAVARRNPDSALIVCDGVQFQDDVVLAPNLLVGPLGLQLRLTKERELSGRFYRELLESFNIPCPAQTLVPRHIVDEIGPVSEARNETPDYDYYLRIAIAHPITLHARSLVRWRYRASSMSGAWSRRPTVWAAQKLPILRRQLDLAPAEDRPLVEKRIRALERATAPGWHPARLAGRAAWVARYWIARVLPRRAAER